MKKALVILMAISMLFAMGSMALARQEGPTPGNIVANEYNAPTSGSTDWDVFEQGTKVTEGAYGFATSTHVYGTWNSPYTAGVDGYNYNDAQDYTADGTQVDKSTGGAPTSGSAAANVIYQSGPHGGYLTSTHRCRECHAVHRAAGKFKLLRSDTRFEACDWCHGTGAGSGYNIQMDNDDIYTEEYNVGHTMGYGIEGGKWKAPDDTYPAFTPNYWQGGFSCFDCHSPHANPSRLLGYKDNGTPGGSKLTSGPNINKYVSIANPGHDVAGANANPGAPIYLAGSWILIKNPDREIATDTETVRYRDYKTTSSVVYVTETINPGMEISDKVYSNTDADGNVVYGLLGQYAKNMGWTTGLDLNNSTDTANKYPVNKMPTDWNTPVGMATATQDDIDDYNTGKPFWSVNEFCADCHDGNAGLHTVQAPLFSEDRALRGQDATNGGSFDLAYGHDSTPRH